MLIFLGLVTAILIAVPRHPHPSTIKTIEVTGRNKNGCLTWNLNVKKIAYLRKSILPYKFFLFILDDLLPYEDKNGDQPKHDEVVKIYDNMFILRVVLSLLLGLTALIGGIYTLLKHFCEQRYAEPVGRSKLVGWTFIFSTIIICKKLTRIYCQVKKRK